MPFWQECNRNETVFLVPDVGKNMLLINPTTGNVNFDPVVITCDLSLRMSHVCLERMCILLQLDQ